MRVNLYRGLLGASLLALVACGGGGNSTAPIASGPAASSNTPVFDPSTGNVPLPNILASATALDPITAYVPTVAPGVTPPAPAARPANTPMTPPEALAYVNLREVGGTNAVAGMNAPIYIRFAGPVDATTVTPANIKVFQLTPDAAGTENAALGFTDISATFSYRYTAGGTDLFLFPNYPMLPGTRYLYVVTNRVKDAASTLPISSPGYFEALKTTVPLTGAFAALEPIRANAVAGSNVLLSGYAKVLNDLVAASATTTVTSRADVAVLGRFITTAAGAISTTTTSPSAAGASLLPVEAALRAFAAGPALGGLPGKTWANTIAVTTTFTKGGSPYSTNAYWAGVLTAGGQTVTAAPATVGTVVLGTFNSAELSLDPVVVAAFHAANPALLDLTGTTGAYNPAAGVTQAFRPDGLHLTGFYHTTRTVPFVYIAPDPAVVGAAPAGGWPLVIFQHGITSQKETIIALAQSATAVGRAIVAIDMPLHGGLAVPTHTTGTVWGQDFMAVGAPLATRTNVQQGAFNLNRLEFTIRTGGFAALGAAAPSLTKFSFVGHSLGSIVGAYYLAGNTTLSATGYPYTQTTLNSDMKGYLSVPGARTAYIIQNSPAFSPSVDAGLAAVGITKNSPTYHNFFQVTQSVVDPIDPASITTPLAAGLPSRLSNRVAMQESTTSTYSTTLGSDGLPVPSDGDLVIANAYTRYFANALGGREVLGTAGAAVAPGFKQLAYTAGGTPAHAAGVVGTPFLYTLSGTSPAPKVANAATTAAGTTPTEGVFQFDQTGIGHSSLLDPTASATNTGLIQKQFRYFLGITGTSIVVDPTQGATLPIAPVALEGLQVPAQYVIFGH